MGLAKPRPIENPADEEAIACDGNSGSLDPAEVLVGRLAPEALLRAAGKQRIGRTVEQVDGASEQAAQLNDFRNELVREAAGFDANACRAFDQLRNLGERLS